MLEHGVEGRRGEAPSPRACWPPGSPGDQWCSRAGCREVQRDGTAGLVGCLGLEAAEQAGERRRCPICQPERPDRQGELAFLVAWLTANGLDHQDHEVS